MEELDDEYCFKVKKKVVEVWGFVEELVNEVFNSI